MTSPVHDLKDRKLEMSQLRVPQLHLLYCWRCDLGDLDYRVLPGGVQVLTERSERDLGPFEADDFPYDDYPMAFPKRTAWIDRLPAGDAPASQIGGNRAMRFVASFGDACADPRGFTGNAYVHVVFYVCLPCKRVHAQNVSD